MQRPGGARARLKDYGSKSRLRREKKVLPRRLRGVCQIVVFTVRKLMVFSGSTIRNNSAHFYFFKFMENNKHEKQTL